MTILMNSHLELQFYMHGKSRRIWWSMHMSNCMVPFSPTWHQSWLHGTPQYQQWRPEKVSWWGGFMDSLSSMSQQESDKQKYWQNYWHFWKEFKHFTYRTGPYSYQSSCFENDDYLSGQSHLWHEMHSLPFTVVLGCVACQTTSKHKASWDRICRVILERCEDHQEWQEGKYWWWIPDEKGYFVHICKAEGG